MSSGRRKLLLADDSPTIQKVISLTFGDEEFEVVAVGDGAQALRALAEEPPPDIVLADVAMPGPDGYELCERIKGDGRLRHVPVILLVGTFEPFNEAEARRVGADTVLTKPFQSIRDLVSKVGSLLGGGEPKEDEAARGAPAAGQPPAEPSAARREVASQPAAETRGAAAFGAAEEVRGADPSSSFADLGADDELIPPAGAEAFAATCDRIANTLETSAGDAMPVGPSKSYAGAVSKTFATLGKRFKGRHRFGTDPRAPRPKITSVRKLSEAMTDLGWTDSRIKGKVVRLPNLPGHPWNALYLGEARRDGELVILGLENEDTNVRVFPRYTAFDLYLVDQAGLTKLNEGQRLDDLESHLALNPELATGEEEEESETDF